jgi:DNA-binding CsgD family transcriptional regulator
MMRILDAVYDVEQPRESWLKGILLSLTPALDWGAGVAGVLYDISSHDRLRLDAQENVGCSAAWHEAGRQMHEDPRFVPSIIAGYRSFLCATLPELSADRRLIGGVRREFHSPHGVQGQVAINGIDCSGKGCALYLFAHDPVDLSDAQRALFRRLATHLASGYRLQRRLAAGEPSRSASLEAVLTPAGTVEHAEADATSTEARQSLTAAVRRRERSRGALDAERVVGSLKGLVAARWTLVDHYESGGKRYILARENAPNPSATARLSPREQQVVALAALGRTNKLIAYELGLAYSTVRVLIARACAKVGAPSRSDLVSRHGGVTSSR